MTRLQPRTSWILYVPQMPMQAIISDIHANLEALESVLADIQRRSIGQVICLGDVVGYGPDPRACVEHAREFQLCLGGNWDQFVGNQIREPESKSNQLHEQHAWTRSQLSPDQIEFLSTLPSCRQHAGLTFAHGGPLDYVNQYVFPECVYEREHLDRMFSAFDGIFICGHTHLPGVIEKYSYAEPATIDNRFVAAGTPAIINVGSVGQPRDGDNRACYVVHDENSFEFVRVEYDIDRTTQKINELGWGPSGNGT